SPEEQRKDGLQRDRFTNAYEGRFSESIFKRTGLKMDLERPYGYQQILKMGRRIEGVREVAPDRAWIHVAGRNLDGTPYHCSEYRIRINGEWRQNGYPKRNEVITLPPGFPPPIVDYDEGLKVMADAAAKSTEAPTKRGRAAPKR